MDFSVCKPGDLRLDENPLDLGKATRQDVLAWTLLPLGSPHGFPRQGKGQGSENGFRFTVTWLKNGTADSWASRISAGHGPMVPELWSSVGVFVCSAAELISPEFKSLLKLPAHSPAEERCWDDTDWNMIMWSTWRNLGQGGSADWRICPPSQLVVLVRKPRRSRHKGSWSRILDPAYIIGNVWNGNIWKYLQFKVSLSIYI